MTSSNYSATVLDHPQSWDFKEGEVFTFRSEVYLVVRPKRANVIAMLLTDGRNYDIPMAGVSAASIRPATDAEKATIEKYATPESTDAFLVGSIISIKNVAHATKVGSTVDTLHVVTKIAGNIVNFIDLGGRNDNRYFRFPKSELNLIPLSELAARLSLSK